MSNENKGAALRKWREERDAMGEDAPPIERVDPIEKARRSPNSLRAAINGKCWDCMAGGDKSTITRIRECPAGKHCTLYPVRPYQPKE